MNLWNVENPDPEDDDGFDEGDSADERRVEQGKPADGLGVDNVEDVLRQVELYYAHSFSQGRRVFAWTESPGKEMEFKFFIKCLKWPCYTKPEEGCTGQIE